MCILPEKFVASSLLVYMLYTILKYIAKGMLRIYFGKVYVRGMNQVPKDKPLILAANHQSAFIEPVLLGAMLPFPVHFITRGDVFVKKYMWFFKATNQIPIFRFHDGYSQMKKNLDSFDYVYEALNKGARVIIFCEGHMKWEKKLHNLQLGASRMALGAYMQHKDLDIYIQPIGMNYEDHNIFRRYCKISFAEPIRLKDYIQSDKINQREILVEVTKELKKRLQPEVIHIDAEVHYDLANKVLAMYDNKEKRAFFPLYEKKSSHIQGSIDFAHKLSILDRDEAFRQKVQHYVEHVGEPFTYMDYSLVHFESMDNLPSKCWRAIMTILGSIGVLLNGLPVYLSEKITLSRTSIPEFIGSIKSSLGLVFYLLYYILIVGASLIIDWKIGIWIALILASTGLIATYYWDRKKYWQAFRKWRSQEATTRGELIEQRQSILETFQ